MFVSSFLISSSCILYYTNIKVFVCRVEVRYIHTYIYIYIHTYIYIYFTLISTQS